MHKVARDLTITLAIGSAVLAIAAGLIYWLTRPPAMKAIETLAEIPIVEPSATPEEQPQVTVVEPAEQPPVIKEAPDKTAELAPEVHKLISQLGVDANALAIPVARFLLANSSEWWHASSEQERKLVCVWYAHRFRPTDPLDTKIAIGALFFEFLTNAYQKPLEESKPSELVALYTTLAGDSLLTDATAMLGRMKLRVMEEEARKLGRIIRVEVLAKSVENYRGQLRLRITNRSSDEIDILQLQVEMTLLGKHVGIGNASEFRLLPSQERIVEVISSKSITEGFDDYTITISKQPSKGYYVVELLK